MINQLFRQHRATLKQNIFITILLTTNYLAGISQKSDKIYDKDLASAQSFLQTVEKQLYPTPDSVKMDFKNFVKENIQIANNTEETKSDDCSYYLKYPPVVNSMILTEDCYKKMALHVKEEFSDYNIELKLRIYEPGGFYYTDYTYPMHDDGTMGDEIAGDNIYTNNMILFTYNETKSYQFKTIISFTNFIENGNVLHTDRNYMSFLDVNKYFLDGLTVPNVNYLGCSGEIMWSNNFIYTMKNENWKELDWQSLCGFDYDYIESQELTFNYWDENEIFSNKDDYMYCQIDFVEPYGQYSYTDGNSMYLSFYSIFGPLVHEILHRWIPSINDKLGLLSSDSYNGHHPNIFQNTSGFLYSSWARENGIFYKDQLNNIVKLNDSIQYVYTNYNAPPKIDETKRQQFNDYEMYLMGLIPIDSVDFPVYFLKNLYKTEYLIDSITGFATGKKDYFKELVEISQDQLFEAKNLMLAEYPWRTNFDGKIVKILPVFTGSHFLSVDEIKMVNLLAEEISTKSETRMDNTNMHFQTYYQATKGKGEVILYVPEPKNSQNTPTSIEEVEICEGENYQNWTKSGKYIRKFKSTTGCDSIVITNLTIEHVDKPNITQIENTLISSTESGNQWYLEQNEIIGATDQTYIINQSGNYSVQVTSENGCISEMSAVVSVLLTSVNNINFLLKIYPNPTTGLLQIEGLPQNDKTIISIYSTLGQIIEQKVYVNSNATIDLSHYKKGIYFLSFNNNFNSSIKIIKK